MGKIEQLTLGPTMSRPNVSVIVPFAGSHDELRAVAARLARLDLHVGDDLVIVDNSRPPHALRDLPRPVRVVDAVREGSSYYSRNVGVRATRCAWLLFMDADCDPAVDILDAYFLQAVPASVGAVAGRIDAMPARSLVERYASSRKHLDADAAMRQSSGGYGATANLLVRREALEAVGGFSEGIRSAGDQDLCWRLTQEGWELRLSPRAVVQHAHRTNLRSLLVQMRRYGAGATWLRRRHGSPSPAWVGSLRMAKGIARLLVAVVRRDREAVRFAALDVAAAGAYVSGSFASNGPYWCESTGSDS